MTHPELLAAVRQLAAAHTGYSMYAVCSRAPPFLGFLCALFPEYEFHVYDPSPKFSVWPFGEGSRYRRSMPAWLYRHELCPVDRAYWGERKGDTVVFLGESADLEQQSCWNLIPDGGKGAGQPFAPVHDGSRTSELLGDQCPRRCGQCATEIKTWLTYIRRGTSCRLSPEAEAKAVRTLMAATVKKQHLRHPKHATEPPIKNPDDAQGIKMRSRPSEQTTRNLPSADTARKKEAAASVVSQSTAAEKPRNEIDPPSSYLGSVDASDPQLSLPDWEQLSAEMVAFGASSRKKGKGGKSAKPQFPTAAKNNIYRAGVLGGERADVWARSVAKK